MAKKCLYEGCSNNQFGGGYCKFHQRRRNDIQKKINPITENTAEERRLYSTKYRPEYLEAHPICQCGRNGCQRPADEVHHKKGRGKYLNVVKFFLAVNHLCHKWIHANVEESVKLGLIILRNERLRVYDKTKQNTMDGSDLEPVARMPQSK